MARSIYQGSAAAVCQARELSARRRARGLEKKATGSFLLSLLLFFSLSSPRSCSLFSSPSYVHILNPSLARPLLLPLLPFAFSLSLFSFPLHPLLFPSLLLLLGNFSSLQRTTEAPRRRRRRCCGYAHRSRAWARARARARTRDRMGVKVHRYMRPVDVQCARLSDVSL